MGHILLVNPNTSAEMTNHIEQTASEIASSTTEITALCPSNGPESLESFYEYHLAAVASIDTVQEFEAED